MGERRGELLLVAEQRELDLRAAGVELLQRQDAERDRAPRGRRAGVEQDEVVAAMGRQRAVGLVVDAEVEVRGARAVGLADEARQPRRGADRVQALRVRPRRPVALDRRRMELRLVVLHEVGACGGVADPHRGGNRLPAGREHDVGAAGRGRVGQAADGCAHRAEEVVELLLELRVGGAGVALLLVDEQQLDLVPPGLEPAHEVGDRLVAAAAPAELRDDDRDTQDVAGGRGVAGEPNGALRERLREVRRETQRALLGAPPDERGHAPQATCGCRSSAPRGRPSRGRRRSPSATAGRRSARACGAWRRSAR